MNEESLKEAVNEALRALEEHDKYLLLSEDRQQAELWPKMDAAEKRLEKAIWKRMELERSGERRYASWERYIEAREEARALELGYEIILKKLEEKYREVTKTREELTDTYCKALYALVCHE